MLRPADNQVLCPHRPNVEGSCSFATNVLGNGGGQISCLEGPLQVQSFMGLQHHDDNVCALHGSVALASFNQVTLRLCGASTVVGRRDHRVSRQSAWTSSSAEQLFVVVSRAGKDLHLQCWWVHVR
ncbi:hypothetical protein MRX96_053954 [Rhipicephalus microplus]